MGVEFEMYALPSFSSCWDEDVLKFLYWLIQLWFKCVLIQKRRLL